jgi:hypothetical protein
MPIRRVELRGLLRYMEADHVGATCLFQGSLYLECGGKRDPALNRFLGMRFRSNPKRRRRFALPAHSKRWLFRRGLNDQDVFVLLLAPGGRQLFN